jgi:hypothetical protein
VIRECQFSVASHTGHRVEQARIGPEDQPGARTEVISASCRRHRDQQKERAQPHILTIAHAHRPYIGSIWKVPPALPW